MERFVNRCPGRDPALFGLQITREGYLEFHFRRTVDYFSPNVTALSLHESAGTWPATKQMTNDVRMVLARHYSAPLIEESGIDRLRIEALSIAHGSLSDPTIIFAHDSVCPLNVTHLHTVWIHVRSDYRCHWIRHQEFISHVSRSLETLGINLSSFSNMTLPSLSWAAIS
ncbi:hypothetical protein JOM56_000578 [Amanita muscaria]